MNTAHMNKFIAMSRCKSAMLFYFQGFIRTHMHVVAFAHTRKHKIRLYFCR